MKKLTSIIIMGLMIICFNQTNAQDQKLKITIGSNEFTATLNNNETVNAFVDMLPMTVNMTEMGGYEKFFYLPQNLPGTASNIGTTYEGDLMIWSGNCLVLFYTTRSTSYSYIRLGRIDNTNGLRQAVGSGNVEITFELENPAVNIEHIKTLNNLYKVSPNPASDYIHVSGEFEQLSVYNENGIFITESKEKTIHTGHFASGVYLIKINTKDNGTLIRKIIKK